RLLNDDPPGLLLPGNKSEAVARSDLSGHASVSRGQLTPRPGAKRVGVAIIRPSDPTAPSGTALWPATSGATGPWGGPHASLNPAGPGSGGLGQEAAYALTVTNSGQAETRSLKLTNPIPEGMQYVRSNPPAAVVGNQLIWTLGRLQPGEKHQVEAVFK